MKDKDSLLTTDHSRVGPGGDENLPPIRSGTHLSGKKKTQTRPTEQKKNKKSAPRDYKEWDK